MRDRFQELRLPLRFHDFRYLWLAQVFSELGDWAGRLALAVLVAQQTGSALLTALVTTASVLPYIGIGQLLAAWTNRFKRLHVIILADLIRASIYAPLALFHMPVWMILLLAFLAGCLTPPFEAARNALTVLTVPTPVYGAAIVIASITFDAAVLFGYAGGGALLAVVGARSALAINAVSFVASALLLSQVIVARQPAHEGPPVRVRDGWRALVDDAFVRRFFVTYLVAGACAVVGESLVAIYALDVLDGSAGISGLLAAAIPTGAIAATILARPTGSDTAKMRRSSEVALIGSLIGIGVFIAAPDLPTVLIAFAGVGMLNASRVPANEVSVLRLTDRMRGPAFSVLNGFLLGSQAIAAAAGGFVARGIGVRETIIASLVISGVVGAWGAARPPHELKHAKVE